MSTAAENLPHIQPAAPTAEINRVFAAQQQRALQLRKSTVEERVAKLKKMKELLLARTEEACAAGHADFGKPAAEAELTEVMPVIAEINDAVKHLKKWMKPKKVAATLTMLGTASQIRYEPKGVALIIAPWNYPINLCLGPLVSAIAAGCTAILKPSEMTPHSSEFMQKLVAELFPEDEVAMFQGGVEVSTALLAMPFDHIFFTGSPQVGKIVMEAASKHLTSVTLELGGKSPFIVDKSANLKDTAKKLAWGKGVNNGQTCIAPDIAYVHEDVVDELIGLLKDRWAKVYGKDGEAVRQSPHYARIVNDRHHGRLVSLLDDARQKGAKVVIGGTNTGNDNFFEPTVVTDASDDTRVMQEEIFGPVLPIRSFRDISEPIAEINARPKPLALYLFAKDKALTEKVLDETAAGTSCINHCMVQFLHGNLPFGGVNNSGIGHGHGHYGFIAFSHERPVVEDHFSSVWMFFPPYTGLVKKLIKIATRWLV